MSSVTPYRNVPYSTKQNLETKSSSFTSLSRSSKKKEEATHFALRPALNQIVRHFLLRCSHLCSRYAAVALPSETPPLTPPAPPTASAEELAAATAGAGLLPPVSSTSSSMAAPSLDPARIESVEGLEEGRPRLVKVDVAGEDRVWLWPPLLTLSPPLPERLYKGASFCRSCFCRPKKRAPSRRSTKRRQAHGDKRDKTRRGGVRSISRPSRSAIFHHRKPWCELILAYLHA